MSVIKFMNILVCVKQVPDTETQIRINDSNNWIQIEDNAVFRMNRFDEFAIEEALRIKESFPDVKIDAISVGPTHVTSTIKRAMEMGADKGIHIFIDDERYHSPYETASLIASYAVDKNYDLIFTGVMAEDDMQCQVGQLIAGILDLPFASSCIHEKLAPGLRTIYVEREIEGGLRESFKLSLPALLTIQSGINRPRYPSLSNILRAKKQEIISIDAESLTIPDERERITAISYPKKSGQGITIEGSPEKKAAKLLDILHEEPLI